MFRKLIGPLLIAGFVAAVSAAPQNPPAQNPPAQAGANAAARPVTPEKIDADMNAKIKAEGMDRSKIMWIEHMLADVYGPRPIGSPNHKAAADWAVKTMASWGMKSHLEPFPWGGVGWMPGKASGYITSPVHANLKFEAQPWSPSTKGTVTGEVIVITPPVNPTPAQLDEYLANLAPKVKGGIVMATPPVAVGVIFTERQKRIPDDQAKASYQPRDPNDPNAGRGGRGAGTRGAGAGAPGAPTGAPGAPLTAAAAGAPGAPGAPAGGGRGNRGAGGAAAPATADGHVSAAEVTARITQLLKDNPPALRLTEDSARDATVREPGVIVAQNGAGQIYDDQTAQSPTVILRYDDYGRIYRIAHDDGTPVTVEFNMQNQFFPEGKTSYITVGEIPGTDKADEVIMIGGHLDSWASATGATDNGIGCAIMMEAARILEATGAKPRRTIRVALWSGEEEGELGSFAYVANHFGSAEHPKEPEFSKLDSYWNIDDGTGRVRGASIFGPPEAATILAQFFKPWEDWGIYGASASTARTEGGSDNGAFAVAGLPGIGTRQDNIEYNSVTWHTNLDNYERIVPDDVMKNATITASVMYHLAMRDEMLPRFAKDKMPAEPAARGGGAGAGAGGAGGRGGGRGANGPAPAPAHLYLAAKGVALTVPAKIGLTPPRQPAAQAPALNAPAAPARTVKVTTQPAHGTLTMIAGGGFTYTPAAGFTGTDTFAYTITTVTPAPTTPPATPTTPPATGAAAEVQIGGGPGAAVATTTTTPPGTVTLVVK